MELNKSNFGNRKCSANPNFLDFTLPTDQINRNIKQKMIRSLETNEGNEHAPHYSSSSRGAM